MKKVLFATTALVATAGVAAADVTFGGLGRFGVLYVDNAATETTLESRFRLVVTATAESDNGLSFGAQIRYQSNEHRSSYTGGGAGFNTPRFWVSTQGFTVSVGQVLGAIENMPGMYTGSVGLTGLGYANVVYNFAADAYTSGGAGAQGLDVLWSSGNWGVHFSYSWTGQGNTQTDDRVAAHVSYSMGNWNFALGGQDSNIAGDTSWAATVGGTWGNFDGTLQYADNDGNAKWGIAGNYQAGASTFVRGYINTDDAINDENYGLGFQHRMGGGTFLEGGIASLAGNTRADLGLRFSF
ncbi:outer membrane protein OmpU [Shimia gijangensis]|uniref:Outer membrane protein OmpU n=1 Tax=Shimia gijangensis TaxID=1470563 RepID=A0A1M6NN81_9RHOB|nr:porin [Shimia gijangensis]SHJ97056.1 outer membrane protein OmpU [Shimia gijangensis]